MDCLRLLETPNTLSYAGLFIDLESTELLKNSLLILQNENHFRKCYYWGRINGITNDYHISYGYRKDCLNDQVYYYSIDCMNWLLMPVATTASKLLTTLTINNFQGDTAMSTNVVNMNLLSEEEKEEEEVKAKGNNKSIIKYFKEEDRLAATVELIKEEAMIIPRGSWFKCPNGNIIENEAFSGLTYLEASDLKSYLHARSPFQKWNTNLLTRSDYNYSMDFLDTVDLDIPRGCWNLQFYLGDRLAILHSLYWPGMTFFHKIDTPYYGSLYIGQGKKNVDLPFMI